MVCGGAIVQVCWCSTVRLGLLEQSRSRQGFMSPTTAILTRPRLRWFSAPNAAHPDLQNVNRIKRRETSCSGPGAHSRSKSLGLGRKRRAFQQAAPCNYQWHQEMLRNITKKWEVYHAFCIPSPGLPATDKTERSSYGMYLCSACPRPKAIAFATSVRP